MDKKEKKEEKIRKEDLEIKPGSGVGFANSTIMAEAMGKKVCIS